jgi:hypothetical protein
MYKMRMELRAASRLVLTLGRHRLAMRVEAFAIYYPKDVVMSGPSGRSPMRKALACI